jgi:TPP-dependent indolepyruvate ferredoxin oxidoreductase alpha subunit
MFTLEDVGHRNNKASCSIPDNLFNNVKMLKSEDFAQELINNGYDFFTGVPYTIIGNLITTLTERPDITYIPAVREDLAIAVASGAYMAGLWEQRRRLTR